MICNNLSVTPDGRLLFAGRDLRELSEFYGTPLYVMDEDRIREMCRIYREAMQEAFGDNTQPLYASKACSFKQMYRIMKEEGMGVDVVSCGELYTALQAGFDVSRAYFHSNNKTDEDIRFAIESGIGCFVADNEEEVEAVNRIAGELEKKQNMLLRLTPGIDPHTYEEVATGKVDSKFGSAIETGQALAITKKTLSCENISLLGFHCHVGSQVFDSDVFIRSAEIMLDFILQVKNECGYEALQLDLGGGYGVRYTEKDPVLDLKEKILEVGIFVKNYCKTHGISQPKILMEPGRSIVADAGLTLYTVGTVREIPSFRNYVSVDGGMPDNPRYTLYGSIYTPVIANRACDAKDYPCTIAGRCCESGDLLAENAMIQRCSRGDILAVLVTGAYNYSMASNYNRIPRPPVVMVKDGTSYIAVERESYGDLVRLDK